MACLVISCRVMSCRVLSLARAVDKSRVPLVRLLASRLRLCSVASCHVLLRRAVPRNLMSLTRVVVRHVGWSSRVLCEIMSRYVASCHVMSCPVMTSHVM